MQKIKLIVFFIIGYFTISCGSENVKNLGPSEFANFIKNQTDVHIIDVRTAEEYSSSKIDGAINIPINSADFESQIANLSKDKKILVYCLSGSRSLGASNYLIQNGFKEVYNLEGGLLTWQSTNLPLTQSQSLPSDQNISLEKFKSLTKSDKTILVDFYAEWCGPCKQMEPSLNEIADENPDTMSLIRIDVDKNPELAQALKIEGIPLFHIYKNEKLTYQSLGMVSKETLLENL
jgi:thioredoxin